MKYVAFLRGIMPQVKPSHRMENLRKIFEELGFENVKTFLASGNVIFETTSTNKSTLETKIETALAEKADINTKVILRSKDELMDLIKRDPFDGEEFAPHLHPQITFLKDTSKQSEVAFVSDSTNKTTPQIMIEMEKKYSKEITTRTWNTVQRIAKLL